MTTIRLTARDMARVRVRSEPSALIEAAHALRAVLAGPARPGAGRWTRRTRVRLSALPFVRSDLAEAHGLVSDVLALVSPAHDGVPAPHAPERVRRAARTLTRVARAVITPDLDRLRVIRVRAAYRIGALLAGEGAERALEALGGGCRWTDTGVELPDGRDREVDPGGYGFELVPSVFLESVPRVERWIDPDEGRPRTALLFPALGADDALDPLLAETPDRSQEALGRLLGRTRAAVLGEVLSPSSTGELARTLHVSPTCVSEHTAVLREAGLITTTREGNRVRHTATGLGRSLLDRDGARNTGHGNRGWDPWAESA
ncbi:helix-turn-helix domain-containing protein [Nocardiopsis sp. N85]|uniref:helix-turn-helix domain-containing protein n=1 Tax=Nocardiopsis sp. N85 TaxID=3029400 RepID=UPI00237F3264|nr:helix-turn-helix domain-containing protein [Nocardiopsis sp. N85]MDE3722563.1 helix-turn-helix domain-containing protein [Nocardiopsis sp. N85]